MQSNNDISLSADKNGRDNAKDNAKLRKSKRQLRRRILINFNPSNRNLRCTLAL